MADHVGSLQRSLGSQADGDRYLVAGQSANVTAAKTAPPQTNGLFLLSTPAFDGTWEATGEGLVELRELTSWTGEVLEGPSEHWFDAVHVNPLTIELGNLVTTVVEEIEIYNAFRDLGHQLTAAVNNAGEGISFPGLPSLPWTIAPQNGLVVEVQVLTDGPPNIDGTLDFTLDVGAYGVSITGTRVVMFAFEPEAPIGEVLEFKTLIIESMDGSEQRASLRKHPRQLLNFTLKLDEAQRRYFQALMFGFQPGTFGVPIWFEARELTASASLGALTIQVDTRWADFRVDGLAMVWTDENTYDVLEVESFTETSITFSSALTHAHSLDTALVMPLRLAITEQEVEVERYQYSLDEVTVKFTVTDNEADLADTSPFDTHNAKVLLGGPNAMSGKTLEDSLLRRMVRLDNETAPVRQSSPWEGSHFRTTKGFVCNTAQELWEVRCLLHALRGSHVSFYLPTFFADLVAVQPLSSGSFEIDVVKIGYAELIRQNEPDTSIWIELTDGTVLTRQVESSLSLDDTTERLTVDVPWASTVPVASIARISFLRLCRVAEDRVNLLHQAPGRAKVTMTVMAVQT